MSKTTNHDHLSARGCAASLHNSKNLPLGEDRFVANSDANELERLVQIYNEKHAPKLVGELKSFNELEDKQEAVRRAVSGRFADGKTKRSHQHLLKNELLNAVAASVDCDEARRHSSDFKTFREYFEQALRRKGYGDLAIYDASLYAFGVFNKHPVIDIVYLPRGAGWGFDSLQRGLSDKIEVYKDKNGRRYAKRADFPLPISQLPGEQIENFLCTFMKALKTT